LIYYTLDTTPNSDISQAVPINANQQNYGAIQTANEDNWYLVSSKYSASYQIDISTGYQYEVYSNIFGTLTPMQGSSFNLKPNRISRVEAEGKTTNYAYDYRGNRVNESTTDVSFDESGFEYVYDDLNHLKSTVKTDVTALMDEDGKRKTPSKTTKLPVKGNKKRAEQMLYEAKRDMENELRERAEKGDINHILFSDFMLEMSKQNIELTTYSSYQYSVEKVIAPYFKARKIKLKDLTAKHIQNFYNEQVKRVKSTTVIHYHANMHKALKYAVKMEMILSNPCERIERPKKEAFQGSFYSNDEMNKLFEAVKGQRIELGVSRGK